MVQGNLLINVDFDLHSDFDGIDAGVRDSSAPSTRARAPIHVALKDRPLDTPRGAVGVHGDSDTEF